MAKLYNLARMTTASTAPSSGTQTGTPITLGSAVSGFLSFATAGIADGETVTYAIEDGTNSEIGRGVYTASGTTLTRSVLKSTNSDNAIGLSGTAQVFITPAAEDFLFSVNAQTGTSYTIVQNDLGKLVTFSNASSVAVTLPQATGSFAAGWNVHVLNKGAGTVTITPTTSTINNGASTLVLTTGHSALIVSDGTNYQTTNRVVSTVAAGKALVANNTLTLAGTDSTTMTFPSTSSTVVTTGNTATITKGYTVTPNNIGTVSSGTTTLDPSLGNYQYLTWNATTGTVYIAAPSSDCAIDILWTNNATGTLIGPTFSGFTVASSTGSSFLTTNNNKYILSVRRINGVSTYSWYALQ